VGDYAGKDSNYTGLGSPDLSQADQNIKGYTPSQMITKVKLWYPSIWYSTDSVLDINIEVVEN